MKKGVCEICVEEHLRLHHEVVDLNDAINECKGVLLNVESNALSMLSEEVNGANEFWRKLEMIEKDKSDFVGEQ